MQAANSSFWFTHLAKWIAHLMGRPLTFIWAVLVIVVWAATGPLFHYSDTWQLIINTSTTIVTFLMVFVIQNTQNRDSEAIQVKLDELIKTNQEANNMLLNLEELNEDDIEKIRATYEELAEQSRQKSKQTDSES